MAVEDEAGVLHPKLRRQPQAQGGDDGLNNQFAALGSLDARLEAGVGPT